MPQEDCAVKEEISQLDALGIDIDDGPIDVAIGGKGISCASFVYSS
jgi:sentrin-specific protease 7